MLTVELHSPMRQTVSAPLAGLASENVVTFAGAFPNESFIIHRLVGPAEYATTLRWNDTRPRQGGTDYYYVRVRQYNGHMAWSSPIWVG